MRIILQTGYSETFKYIVSYLNNILTIAAFRPPREEEKLLPVNENLVSSFNNMIQNPLDPDNFIDRASIFTGKSLGFSSEEKLVFYGIQSFSLEELFGQGSGSMSGHELWLFDFKGVVANNIFADTYLSKTPLKTKGAISGMHRVLLYKPFQNDSLDSSNVILRIKVRNASDVRCINGITSANLEETSSNEMFKFPKVFPAVELSSINAIPPTGITVTATCTFKDQPCPDGTELFFETSAGYLSKTRVKTVNGQASTKLIPFGVESGEPIRVQCGFRLYSGIASVDGMVIDAV